LPGTARADWDDRPEPGEFEESLNPYGYWVDAPGYGRVWRPNEEWGWRPYVDGQWIWTSYGWTWSSPEPWGWTFHYGRWGWANTYGWVWDAGLHVGSRVGRLVLGRRLRRLGAARRRPASS
jgi:hypothetical protein